MEPGVFACKGKLDKMLYTLKRKVLNHPVLICSGLMLVLLVMLASPTAHGDQASASPTPEASTPSVHASVSSIPEPGTVALLGLGGIGILIRRKRRVV